MATFFKFLAFKEDSYEAVHNLGSHTLAVYLTNAAPDAALDTVKADLAEIATGNGYTGPVALTGVTSGLNGTIYELTANDLTTAGAGPMVTASGGPVGPFQHVVLFNDSTAAKVDPLIGCWSYPQAITLNDGEKFELDFGATILTHD